MIPAGEAIPFPRSGFLKNVARVTRPASQIASTLMFLVPGLWQIGWRIGVKEKAEVSLYLSLDDGESFHEVPGSKTAGKGQLFGMVTVHAPRPNARVQIRTSTGLVLDGPKSLSVSRLENCPEVAAEPISPEEELRRTIGNPGTWRGHYHLHVTGKTGEILFASGVIPALREAMPKATLYLHVLDHYEPVCHGLGFRPDAIVVQSGDKELPLYLQTTKIVRADLASYGRLKLEGDHLHTCLYRTHPWINRNAPVVPFYRMFSTAVGVSGYRLPLWSPSSSDLAWKQATTGRRPIALLFASSNPHSGGPPSLPLTSEDYADLARAAKRRGLIPIINRHGQDPKVEAPGWTSVENASITQVLALLRSAKIVMGLNSGIVFAAIRLSTGHAIMADYQAASRYDFHSMVGDGVIDPKRHKQIQARGIDPEIVRENLMVEAKNALA
jgi:hypothetical protein